MSTGQQLIGGIVTLGVGVIVVAAIFQLNKGPGKGGTSVTTAANQSYQKTLSSLYS